MIIALGTSFVITSIWSYAKKENLREFAFRLVFTSGIAMIVQSF